MSGTRRVMGKALGMRIRVSRRGERAIEGAHMTTTIRTLACLAILGLACTIDTELPREVEPDEPFRDHGCGSGRELGIGTLACTYATKMVAQSEYYSWKAKAECIAGDTDHIKCTYDATKEHVGAKWCQWTATPKVEGCAAPMPDEQYPACSDPPAVADATLDQGYIIFAKPFEATLELKPKGNTLCEPTANAKQSDKDNYCRTNVSADMQAKLLALCTGVKSETKEQKVDCCVDKGEPCVVVDDESGGETTLECAAEDTSTSDDGASAEDMWTPDLGSADVDPVPIPD
jgi:hypothetical protein